MAKNDNLNDYLADLYLGIRSKKQNASKNPQNFRSEIESISTADSIPEWDSTDFTREGEPIVKEAVELTITPTEEQQDFTPEPNTYISKVVVEPIPDEYINSDNTGTVYIPELDLFLKETLDFSMIPTNLLGFNHYICFEFSNDGKADTYMGLCIGDRELKAIPTSDPTTSISIYDSNGWVDGNAYKSIHIASAVISRGLCDFLFDNYVTMISFTIDSTAYYVDEGMTWSEFVVSSHNDANFELKHPSISFENAPSGYYILGADGLPVFKDSAITNRAAYTRGIYSGSIIRFTVDGNPYYTIEGWSWGTWVSSVYNTDEFKVIPGSNLVQTAGGATVKAPDGTTVTSGASIVADHAYST